MGTMYDPSAHIPTDGYPGSEHYRFTALTVGLHDAMVELERRAMIDISGHALRTITDRRAGLHALGHNYTGTRWEAEWYEPAAFGFAWKIGDAGISDSDQPIVEFPLERSFEVVEGLYPELVCGHDASSAWVEAAEAGFGDIVCESGRMPTFRVPLSWVLGWHGPNLLMPMRTVAGAEEDDSLEREMPPLTPSPPIGDTGFFHRLGGEPLIPVRLLFNVDAEKLREALASVRERVNAFTASHRLTSPQSSVDAYRRALYSRAGLTHAEVESLVAALDCVETLVRADEAGEDEWDENFWTLGRDLCTTIAPPWEPTD